MLHAIQEHLSVCVKHGAMVNAVSGHVGFFKINLYSWNYISLPQSISKFLLGSDVSSPCFLELSYRLTITSSTGLHSIHPTAGSMQVSFM